MHERRTRNILLEVGLRFCSSLSRLLRRLGRTGHRDETALAVGKIVLVIRDQVLAAGQMVSECARCFSEVKVDFSNVQDVVGGAPDSSSKVKVDLSNVEDGFSKVKLHFSKVKLHFAGVKLHFAGENFISPRVKLHFADYKLNEAYRTSRPQNFA